MQINMQHVKVNAVAALTTTLLFFGAIDRASKVAAATSLVAKAAFSVGFGMNVALAICAIIAWKNPTSTSIQSYAANVGQLLLHGTLA